MFHSTAVPKIPVNAYFIFVARNAALNDDQAVTVLVLIERLCNYATHHFQQPLAINSLTVHR